MTRKARTWTGATMLIVIAFNYLMIAFPLVAKGTSIEATAREIVVRQLKAKKPLGGTRDEYVLQVLKKEKTQIDRSILIMNCAAVSGVILVLSWTAFGLLFHRENYYR